MLLRKRLRIIEVRLWQSRKADSSILVTLMGMATEIRPVQSRKVPYLMLVTLLGIVTEAKLVHILNALNIENQRFTF